MWGFSRNKEKQVRRSQKEMHLSRLDKEIIAKQEFLNELNNELVKMHGQKSKLAVSILEDVVQFESEGLEIPGRKIATTGNDNLDMFKGLMEILDLNPRQQKFAMAIAERKPELLAKGIGFIEDKLTKKMEEAENPNTKVIER